MVAARNIKAGEVVMKEAPLSYGPNDITKPICLGCCAPVTIKSPTCDICGFPMCSKECSNSKVHKEFECEALKKHGYKVDASTFNFGGVELTYAIISPIRTFMLKEKYPDLWNLAWMQMSHLGKRKKLDFWKTETEKIISLLQTMTGLKVLGYNTRGVVPGCAGCAMADFGRSVNPFSTRGDKLCPPIYYWHPRIFRPSDGPAASHVETGVFPVVHDRTINTFFAACFFTTHNLKMHLCTIVFKIYCKRQLTSN